MAAQQGLSYTSSAEHYIAQQPQPQCKWLPLTAELPAPRKKAGDSPFLRLPTEIRLQIYSLLVLPNRAIDLLPSYEKVSASTSDYYNYNKKLPDIDLPATADLENPKLLIRTIEPICYPKRLRRASQHARSKYSVRSDRFRARLMDTTYHCVNTPCSGGSMGIMGANKQIHAEAAELLYSSYTFDFDAHVEAIVPFFQDLTPFARSCVKSVRVVKRALAYEKEFDRCEWSSAMQCLSNADLGLSLRSLDLGIVAGRPGANGWDRIAAYKAGDFNFLKDFEGMEWMRDLLEIKGLRQLCVSAVVEHCPPATNSMAMASYIRFSASIEGGLSDFLKAELLHV